MKPLGQPFGHIEVSGGAWDAVANKPEVMHLTERMSKILLEHGLCARVTVNNTSALIGSRPTVGTNPVEFIFSTTSVFSRLSSSLRLIDFAYAFFDGELTFAGSISDAVKVLDALNLVTDKRRNFREFVVDLSMRAAKIVSPQSMQKFESLDHYSRSAEAYEIFLDRHMQYTCGHFPIGDENIDDAQLKKFNLIERLCAGRIGPLAGKNHLDIGCGWGGMTHYFEQSFGTRSIGNTNCARQKTFAEERFNIQVCLGDFLHLTQLERKFELITIVGMIEHLTPYRRNQLLRVAKHLLASNGVIYLQCITKPKVWIGGDAYRVAQRHVFPGHFLETRDQTVERLENNGFAVLDEFEHRNDYALTTARWVQKIQENEDRLVNILGRREYRIYLGYLALGNRLFSMEGRGSLKRYLVRLA